MLPRPWMTKLTILVFVTGWVHRIDDVASFLTPPTDSAQQHAGSLSRESSDQPCCQCQLDFFDAEECRELPESFAEPGMRIFTSRQLAISCRRAADFSRDRRSFPAQLESQALLL